MRDFDVNKSKKKKDYSLQFKQFDDFDSLWIIVFLFLYRYILSKVFILFLNSQELALLLFTEKERKRELRKVRGGEGMIAVLLDKFER